MDLTETLESYKKHALDYRVNLTGTLDLEEYNGFKNVITLVKWNFVLYRHIKPQFTAEIFHETELDIEGLEAETFVPFEEVTQQLLLEWAIEKVGGADYIETQVWEPGQMEYIDKQILYSFMTLRDPEEFERT